MKQMEEFQYHTAFKQRTDDGVLFKFTVQLPAVVINIQLTYSRVLKLYCVFAFSVRVAVPHIVKTVQIFIYNYGLIYHRIDTHFMIKVADFGLSESLYSKTYFRQEKDQAVRLPVKWLALEALTEGLFSEKSDVVSRVIDRWYNMQYIKYDCLSVCM